jgi:spermidine/putrescine transport system permease protein
MYVFAVTLVFFYLPLLILLIFSFNDGKSIAWQGFTWRWYAELFLYSRDLWIAFQNSILIAITSSLMATVIGTLGAIGLYWYRVHYKKYLQTITYLPLIIPEIIIGVALLIFFSGIKLKLGLFSIFLAHTTFNIPFVLFIVLARIQEFDFSIVEAAYDLGAREIEALVKVIVPMLFPAILSGFLMAMTLSLDDFVITFFVAGPGSSTLPLHIYSMIRFGVSPVINALSVVLIVGTILLTLSTRKMHTHMFKK